MATTEHTAPLEVRATGRTLTGEAIRYGERATDRPERFQPGAFGALGPLVLNLQHDPAIPLASTGDGLEVTDTERALEVRAELRDGAALTLLRRGVLRGLSVEFRSLAERQVGAVRVIERATLEGLGLVDVPAYSGRLEVRDLLDLTMTATVPPDVPLACECVSAVCKWARFIPEAVSEMFDNAIDRVAELVAEELQAAQAAEFARIKQMLPGLETAADHGDTIAVCGNYSRPLASVSRGTLRRAGRYGLAIDLPNDENGRAVLAAHESTGVVVRPYLNVRESEAEQDGETMVYSKAVARAFIVSATDAREGWPAPTVAPTEAPAERSAIPPRRRLWL